MYIINKNGRKKKGRATNLYKMFLMFFSYFSFVIKVYINIYMYTYINIYKYIYIHIYVYIHECMFFFFFNVYNPDREDKHLKKKLF